MTRNNFFKSAIGLLAFGEVCEHLATPPVKWIEYKDADGFIWKMVHNPIYDDLPGIDHKPFSITVSIIDFHQDYKRKQIWLKQK